MLETSTPVTSWFETAAGQRQRCQEVALLAMRELD
jgi:hypothetical protein